MEKPADRILPLLELELDKIVPRPKDYQFRLTTNDKGETRAIPDDYFDSMKHGGVLTVHRHKNEKGEWEFALVDGHHRYAHAKRMAALGKGPATLPVYVLDEEKDISVKDAKYIAAIENLNTEARHGTVNIADAAGVVKAIRTPDADLHADRLPELNVPEAAYKLSSLSYTSLGLISKGEVPVEAAVMVVDKVKDPSRHDRVIGIIGAKMKQEYPNYVPNHELAATLAPRSNDNGKSWVGRTARAPRASYGLSA